MPSRELDALLHELADVDFVYQQAAYPEVEYAFKHPLTQQVAYESQLRERRQRTHASLARALEQRHADQLGEKAALIAHHWEESGDPSRALEWHRRAAVWLVRSDFRAASEQWRRVLELARTATLDSAAVLRLEACSELLYTEYFVGISREEAASLLAEATEIAERLGDRRSLGVCKARYAAVCGFHAKFREMLSVSREVQELALGLGDVELEIGAVGGISRAVSWLGRADEVMQVTARGLAMTSEDPDAGRSITGLSPRSLCGAVRADWLTIMGRFEEGRHLFDQMINMAREQEDRSSMCAALADSVNRSYTGDLERATADGARAFQIAEELNSDSLRAISSYYLVLAHTLAARWSEAVERFEKFQQLGTRTGAEWVLWAQPLAATAYAELGAHDRALELARDAVDRSHAGGLGVITSHAYLGLGRALTLHPELSDRAEAQAALDSAFEAARERSFRVCEPMVEEARAALATRFEDRDAARAALTRAHTLYTEMGATGHAARLASELGLGTG